MTGAKDCHCPKGRLSYLWGKSVLRCQAPHKSSDQLIWFTTQHRLGLESWFKSISKWTWKQFWKLLWASLPQPVQLPPWPAWCTGTDFPKAPGGFRSIGVYWKSRGWCSSVHRYLENPFLPISSRQSQVRQGHGWTGPGTRASTGRWKRFQRLSLKVQLKNHGDTNILSVLGKTKVWSVLDLSRNKNQVLEFYNKVLRKKNKKENLGCCLQPLLTTFQHKSTLKIT